MELGVVFLGLMQEYAIFIQSLVEFVLVVA